MAQSRVNCEELLAGRGGEEGVGPGAQGMSALGVLLCVLVVSGGPRVCQCEGVVLRELGV